VDRNNTTTIREAHEKLVQGGQLPVSVREIINLLSEYATPEAKIWQEALLKLWRGGYRDVVRYDCVSYACGQIPVRAGRLSWMPVGEPHESYTIMRQLEGMEFQFEDLPTVVMTIFRRE
jgi:hypothetical protein